MSSRTAAPSRVALGLAAALAWSPACAAVLGEYDVDSDAASGGAGGVVTAGGGGSGGAAGHTTSLGGGGAGGSGGGGGDSCDGCLHSCEQSHPLAVNLWQAMAQCMFCGACHDRCSAYRPQLCAGGAELGCSSGNADCVDCTLSPCAVYDQCNTELQDCMWVDECFELRACSYQCLTDGPCAF